MLVAGPYPDCSRCNYTKGQFWLPDRDNCHMYYICEKVDLVYGSWYYRIYHPSCGEMYWDQDRLTCVRNVPADCIVGNVVEYIAPSTTYGKLIR